MTLTKPRWCKYAVQKRQSHSGFHWRIFDLKDFKDELILIVSGTLLQVLGALYETVSVPCHCFRIFGIKFFMISKIVTV